MRLCILNNFDHGIIKEIVTDLHEVPLNESPDYILVRSHDLKSSPISDSVKAIARAGTGTDNIPAAECTKRGIVVFNSPAANANAVKEQTLAALIASCRNHAAAWSFIANLRTQIILKIVKPDDISEYIEKNKKKFVGTELFGKTILIIGLGNIGSQVAEVCHHLKMKVIGYDPYRKTWPNNFPITVVKDLKDALPLADFISLHAAPTPETKEMINKAFLEQTKPGVRIINFARGELINDADLISMLHSGHVAHYVTDFQNYKLLLEDWDKVTPFPHLGGSTIEAQDQAVKMVLKQIQDFEIDGTIWNSVNFPNCSLPRESTQQARLTIVNKNVPGALAKITSIISENGGNISNNLNRESLDKSFAYTIVDIDTTTTTEENIEHIVKQLITTPEIIRVRKI